MNTTDKDTIIRLAVSLSAIIIVLWLMVWVIKAFGWFLNVLAPVAAVIIIAAIVYAVITQQKNSSPKSSSKKAPLKITRDTSNKK